MRRSTLLTAILLALFAGLAARAGAAASGPAQQQCAEADPRLSTPCYGADIAGRDGAATAQPGAHEAEVAAYERSWAHRALELQYALAGDVGMRDAPWVGTHNSFNSIAEMGNTLSDTDSNQQLSLVDQLRLDVRGIELDVHWFPSASAGGARAPVVCHALENHGGCSVERPLRPVLDELAAWLRAHPGQVLLLYVEDHLDGADGYDAAATTIDAGLGGLLYRPPGGAACTDLPLGLTRDAVLAAGRQVVIVSGCGSGVAWHGAAFGWAAHKEARPHAYTDYPRCGPDFARSIYDSTLVRYFEDSTGLTATAAEFGQEQKDDGITPATAAAMARCGVDLLGLDQLLPGDGRLDALVWSWAQDEPRAGACAEQGAGGRWRSRSCRGRLRAACRAADGRWSVPRRPVPRSRAAALCRRHRASFAVPRTGYENQLLRGAARGATVWLAYTSTAAGWQALDRRS